MKKMKNNYAAHAQEVLKEAGLKLTKPRLLIIGFMAGTKDAFTPYEIREALASMDVKTDVVTLYRVLDELEQLGLVHRVLALGRYIRCAEEDHCSDHGGGNCHHYLICRNCQGVEEIAGEDLSVLEKKIVKEKGFKVEAHSLEFLGLCAKCQKKLSGKAQ
jgi:Fe2+ or Zn2+ uptake regulation protein